MTYFINNADSPRGIPYASTSGVDDAIGKALTVYRQATEEYGHLVANGFAPLGVFDEHGNCHAFIYQGIVYAPIEEDDE